MTTAQDVIDRLHRSCLDLKAAKRQRDAAIVDASSMGMSLRDVGSVAGLSPTGVSKLLQRVAQPGFLVMKVDGAGYQFLSYAGSWVTGDGEFVPAGAQWFESIELAEAARPSVPADTSGVAIEALRLVARDVVADDDRPATVNATKVISGRTRYQFGGTLEPKSVLNLVNRHGVARYRLENAGTGPIELDPQPPYFDHEWGLKLDVYSLTSASSEIPGSRVDSQMETAKALGVTE